MAAPVHPLVVASSSIPEPQEWFNPTLVPAEFSDNEYPSSSSSWSPEASPIPTGSQEVYAPSPLTSAAGSPSSSRQISPLSDLGQVQTNEDVFAQFAHMPANPLFDDSIFQQTCDTDIFAGIWDHVSPQASCEPEDLGQMFAPAMLFGEMLEPFGFSEGAYYSEPQSQFYPANSLATQSTYDDVWNFSIAP